MNTPAVSIIVPMYNVEKYLDNCLASLLSQTLEDIEVVLVDDGSPDRCGEIADEYAMKDTRVRVVRRENGGLGPARNSGMEMATGEYIGFVDPDDWVDLDMFRRLYDAAKRDGADIVFTGYRAISGGRVIEIRENPFAGKVLNGDGQIYELRRSYYGSPPNRIKDDPLPVSVWVGIYKRSLIQGEGIRFRNIRSEDKFFNTLACRAASRIACVSGTPYCYRKDGQPSITKTLKRSTSESFLELFESLVEMAQGEPDAIRSECLLRAHRCVIDYTRVFVEMVESYAGNIHFKESHVRGLASRRVVSRACEKYPFWRLPVSQIAFYLALRSENVRLMLLLAKMKRAIRWSLHQQVN